MATTGNPLNITKPAAGDTAGAAVYGTVVTGLQTINDAFGMVKIAEAVLTSPAASIPFSGIPATYRHLRLLVYARCDNAAASEVVSLRFNGDGGTNYDNQQVWFYGTTVVATEVFAGALLQFTVSAGTAPANVFSQTEILIAHYAQANNNKDVQITSTLKFGTSTINLGLFSVAGFWRSNAAITSITLTPYSGSDNFVAGTIASLYGMP